MIVWRKRMGAALAHRGATDAIRGVGRWSTGDVTLGVGLPRPDARLGGLAASPRTGACLAVAGRLPPDTSVEDLVEVFDASGISGLERKPGEWIIAVATGSRLSLLRDPAGARTAYWARPGGRVLVAVEPKGIHTVPGFRREIDPAALARYLTFSFVPGAGTMLANLAELQDGHRLDVDAAQDMARITRWFVHEAEPTPGLSEPDHLWISRTRAAVEQASSNGYRPASRW